MAKRIIEISVNDEYVVGSGVVIGAAGSHNDVVLSVTFNKWWRGLNIIATFHDARVENPVAVSVRMSTVSTLVKEGDDYEIHEFSIPHEVKKYEGKITLAFTGYTVVNAAGEGEDPIYQEAAVINTGTAYFNVLASNVKMADELFKNADLGEQLHDDVNTLGSIYGYLNEAVSALNKIVAQLASTSVNVDLNEEGIKSWAMSVADVIYPVGSIYMSVNATSPASLFGGEWERLKDRFLLGAGDTYAAGNTGGSADAVIVEHDHFIFGRDSGATATDYVSGRCYVTTYVSAGDRPYTLKQSVNQTDQPINGVTSKTGVSGVGKNMPPYLTVYMWKRTA